MMPERSPLLHPKIKGSCLCGAVSFEVENVFEKLFLCSCEQCRQITGSAFASNLFVDINAFNWLEGASDIINYQVPMRDISKSFCRTCGSGVPWTNRQRTKMIVPAGSLKDSPVNVVERVKIFASEQPSWASDLERISKHENFPE
jgi:hypothetical protein